MQKRLSPSDEMYYAALAKRSRNYSVDLPSKKWCDLHHAHFDWTGKGNTNRVHRIKHLNALLRALCRVRLELASCNEPYQVFAYVDLQNSADDALYVHTPNPNGSEFPNPIDSVSDVAAIPRLLANRVDSDYYEVRRYREAGSSIYYIVLRDIEQTTAVA